MTTTPMNFPTPKQLDEAGIPTILAIKDIDEAMYWYKGLPKKQQRDFAARLSADGVSITRVYLWLKKNEPHRPHSS